MDNNLIRKQIKETKEIILQADTSDKLYLPLLINSLLSLVVLPIEELKRKPREKIFGSRFIEFQKATGVVPIIFKPIKDVKNRKIIYSNRTPQRFVEKMRNGVAHQCIDIESFENNVYIIIYNVFRKNKYRIKDFEIKLTASELKKLSLYIANCYLKKS